nr:polysaccharide deacetylase family protein [Emticicia oligotrophica]
MRALYPNFVWRKPSTDKTIFLTFDDGPIPEVTEFVLETLEKYQAKATFFCIGDNINKHPEVFKRVIKEGHSVGNHTFNHLRGWATEDEQYLENTEKCKAEIEKFGIKTQLFRPPYGRIKRSQARSILSTNEIIMWDVLSGDFSQDLTPETVLNKTIKYTESGSIVLFHDSIKANKRMAYALPKFLEHFSAQGFKFSKL